MKDDWKAKIIAIRQRREALEAADSARKLAVGARPEIRAARAAAMRKAWADGKFSERVAGNARRTPALVACAKRMRDGGLTYRQIATALGISVYSAWHWCGAPRNPEATNRCPITIGGITYPSLREAERATGVSRWRLRKCT